MPVLDDLDQDVGVDLRAAGTADVEGAAGALVVGRDRDEAHDAVDLVLAEPVRAQVVRGLGLDEPLGARARVHALRGDADDAPAGGGVGRGDADQAVHLLGGDVGDGGALLDRIAGADGHLAAQRPLALDDGAGDPLGQRLHPQGLADDDLVDGLVDRLLEARHVDALLVRAQVAEARDLGVEEPLVALVADPDRLGGAGHAGPERLIGGRRTGLLEVLDDAAGVWCSSGLSLSSGTPVPEHGAFPDRPGL